MNKFKYILLFLLFTVVSCSHAPNDQTNELIVYTSIYPLQFITEQIGGEHVTVYSVYPPGVDAHTYEPTSNKLTEMANGDAFIYIGKGMEGFAEAAVNALQEQQITFIAISDYDHLFIQDIQGYDFDPHLWLDPIKMIDISEVITTHLSELSPHNTNSFKENFNQLKKELQQLHADFNAMSNRHNNKTIVVTHAAYNYWTERYGLEQIAISGISPGEEPSQKQLAELTRIAENKKINYIIFEQHNSDDRIAKIIQDYLQAEKLLIHNLETLTEYDIKNNNNYFDLMYRNIDVLEQALTKDWSDDT